MQLVESGQVKLDEPAATYLPELSGVKVLQDFDASTGKATLGTPKSTPTVRQLLTHTSGFAYEFFDAKLQAYVASGAVPPFSTGDEGFLKAPLMFDPGTRWEYGISADWLGKLVEKVTSQSLDKYFRQHIFEPLGMADTFYNVPADKQERVVATERRQQDGSFVEPPPPPFKMVHSFSGAGGLYSTAGDYLKFERMLLGRGKLGGKRILRAETVEQMTRTHRSRKIPSAFLAHRTSSAWDSRSIQDQSQAGEGAVLWPGPVFSIPISGSIRQITRAPSS